MRQLTSGCYRPVRVLGPAILVLAAAISPVVAQQAGAAADAQASPTFSPVTYAGRIEALHRADVSTVVEGQVSEIHFRAGQKVQAGDRLFTLDPTDYELKVQTAQANLKRTAALLTTAGQDMERATRLKERGSISDVQVLKAKGALALADAVHDMQLAALKGAQSDLARTVIRAPISGVIGRPFVEVGTFAQSGTRKTLARIVQLDQVLLSYQFPYASRMQELKIHDMRSPEGLLSRIELRVVVGDDWIQGLQARPTHASADVDPDTGMMTVWAEIDNPNEVLRPGMKVDVLVSLDGDASNRSSRDR